MAVLVPHSPAPSHHTATVTWPELQRLVSLATACLDLLATPLAMFEPDMSCYVALIQLRPLQVPSRRLAVRCARPAERPEGEPEVATIPIVEHESVSDGGPVRGPAGGRLRLPGQLLLRPVRRLGGRKCFEKIYIFLSNNFKVDQFKK